MKTIIATMPHSQTDHQEGTVSGQVTRVQRAESGKDVLDQIIERSPELDPNTINIQEIEDDCPYPYITFIPKA